MLKSISEIDLAQKLNDLKELFTGAGLALGDLNPNSRLTYHLAKAEARIAAAAGSGDQQQEQQLQALLAKAQTGRDSHKMIFSFRFLSVINHGIFPTLNADLSRYFVQ